MSLEDGVRLVAERDRLMTRDSEENPGGMVALIGADPAEVETAVAASEGVVVAANFNTPRQLVISGEASALEDVAGKVRGRTVKLNVVGAFHSPLMEEAAREMESLVDETELEEPEIPMVGASDGMVLDTSGQIRAALRGQMLFPVRWTAVMGRFFEMGVTEIFEAGEDGTLTRMLRDFKRKDVRGATASEALS